MTRTINWALLAEKAAVAAARENAPYTDCFPGSYERRHLNWDEYAASSAVDALDKAIVDELQKFDSLDRAHAFELEARERKIREVVDREFYDPYVRELRRLRPDLRECGDEGGALGSAMPSTDWWKNVEAAVRKALWEESKLPGPPPMSVSRPHGEVWGLDQEVISTASPRGVRMGWIAPSPWKVYVIMECCSGPLRSGGFTADDKRGWAFMDRAVKRLKKDTFMFTDAGWESYNAAVAYVWVKPRLVG